MRFLNKYMAMAAVLAAPFLSSCSDDFAQPPVPVPEGGIESIGDGSWNRPLSVYQARIGTIVQEKTTDPVTGTVYTAERTESWVTGYIVGWINIDVSSAMGPETARFDTPATVSTNMIMAADPDETDWEKCISVQLPSGEVRTALNLLNNPDNKGKEVTIYGTTGSKYCSVYGVRSVTDFNFGPEGIEPEPITPAEEGAPIYCDFEKGSNIGSYVAAGWVNLATQGGLSGWYLTSFDENTYATCSAYKGNQDAGPYENWLISPGVDMDKANLKTLTFRTQGAYGTPDSKLEVFAMTTNNPATAVMEQLPAKICEPLPDGSKPVYTDWVQSGVIDLSKFTGTVYIGFRYTSAHGGSGFSATYCVDDINIGGAETGAPPVGPIVPAGEMTFKKATSVTSGKIYAIVADGKAATGLTTDAGYLNTTAISVSGDSFTTSETSTAFILTSTEGGYTIRQASNGKYFAGRKFIQTVNLVDSPDANSVFTIAVSDNGAAIVNTTNNGELGFKQEFSQFGLYPAGSSTLPTLYEKVD